MVDKEKLVEDEKKVGELVDKLNGEISLEVNGRPYLLVLATLYEVERDGNKSKIAAQWNWRSNIESRTEGRKESDIEAGKKLIQLLVDQLTDVAERQEGGIKKHYRL